MVNCELQKTRGYITYDEFQSFFNTTHKRPSIRERVKIIHPPEIEPKENYTTDAYADYHQDNFPKDLQDKKNLVMKIKGKSQKLNENPKLRDLTQKALYFANGLIFTFSSIATVNGYDSGKKEQIALGIAGQLLAGLGTYLTYKSSQISKEGYKK